MEICTHYSLQSNHKFVLKYVTHQLFCLHQNNLLLSAMYPDSIRVTHYLMPQLRHLHDALPLESIIY